jgi:mono/diheme cytochrome c family protein
VLRIALAALTALLLAGCGGGGSSSGAAPADAGATVFKDNCVNCHTLKAASATGRVGPNLDQLKPSAALVARQVTNGGGAMPPFGGKLTANQIKAGAHTVPPNAGK